MSLKKLAPLPYHASLLKHLQPFPLVVLKMAPLLDLFRRRLGLRLSGPSLRPTAVTAPLSHAGAAQVWSRREQQNNKSN